MVICSYGGDAACMGKKSKIFFWLLGAFILFVILHNAIYAILGFEEPIFFLLSLASLTGAICVLIYEIFLWIKNFFTSKNEKT